VKITDYSYSCPVCTEPLRLADKTYKCSAGHSYDRAKEGYVNLLLANKKNSNQPGDSVEMILARRFFLEQGHYGPLAKNVSELIGKHLKKSSTFLDAGCGEGYYTNKLFLDHSATIKDFYGFDISKPAIKAAAKKYPEINFFVCSINGITLQTDSVDFALTVFAPLNEKENSRVLKSEGFFLVVSSGPEHLKELAALIYDEVRPHSYDPATQLQSNFELKEKQKLGYKLKLGSQEELSALLKMTPYYWHTPKEKLEQIEKIDSLELTCDFVLSLFSKIG